MNSPWSSSVVRGSIAQFTQQWTRASVSFATQVRKKGARRRTWWNTKLLRGRLYKGSGSGTHMSRREDGHGWFMNPEKVRNFVAPAELPEEEGFELKPYVSVELDAAQHPKRPAPTKWDFLDAMQAAWEKDPEQARKSFEKMQAIRSKLGLKSGNLGKWGS